MPAVSQAQRGAAAMALEAKEGKISPSKLRGAAKDMYHTMSAEQLGHFAGTARKGLPKHKAKSKRK